MKFGVIVFPGSNCDRDMQFALQDDLGYEVIMLWHKDRDLSMFSTEDCIVLPGGFSYGDYLRCGAIARFSPMMQSVVRFAGNGGLVLGVCNGFQILCESHLLPGVLLRNANQQFISKNVYLSQPQGRPLKIPVAHGEGRYFADEKTLDQLESNGQVLWKYCDEKGNITPEANVNGSIRSIAGICNKERNVIGLMPHPERAVSEYLGNTDGRILMEQILKTTKTAVANRQPALANI
ncbi:MAG TPA: phosphoribosylformylglycinamidine synthase subunit PurQ [Puia sp.]|nr:phosphoribosylformylglycinamidine synthase subunit PurQ [Puia sp.]